MLRFQVIALCSIFLITRHRILLLNFQDGEWEVVLAEIVYPHTWYNIRKGKNSVEIYAADNLYLVFKTVEYSIQPGYYEKVQDVIDALYKAGLANLSDVVLLYDDTSKRVTVKCGRHVAAKLRGDITRMFGFLNDTTIRASGEKGFTLALPKTGKSIFLRLYGYHQESISW